jgi:23S rRNA-/tRNA-specific pseudouridylate synthase
LDAQLGQEGFLTYLLMIKIVSKMTTLSCPGLRSLPKIDVLFEDEDCIVVNKPSLMLSVPGRAEVIREPRHVEWMKAIKHAAELDDSNISESCGAVLQRLKNVANIPRKKTSFDVWIKRNIKITDTAIMDEVWNLINVSDRECHKPKLDSMDPSRISVTEIIEECFGTKVYVVHRLDCETSGALIFAKNEASAGELGKQFHSRVVSSCCVVRR